MVMRSLGVTLKVFFLACSIVLVWFLSGMDQAAFRYMGF
jgi:hypothetical protein